MWHVGVSFVILSSKVLTRCGLKPPGKFVQNPPSGRAQPARPMPAGLYGRPVGTFEPVARLPSNLAQWGGGGEGGALQVCPRFSQLAVGTTSETVRVVSWTEIFRNITLSYQ